MSGGHGEKMTRKRSEAISALLSQRTVAAAAAKIGVSESSLLRWMREPAFRAAYRRARRAIVDAAIGQVQTATAEAVEALRRNLNCGTPGVEVRAAQVLLDSAFRGVELGDLAEQVEQLESVLAKLKGERDAAECKG
jgi:hypothetical protein